MKHLISAVTGLTFCAGAAFAGGLDRTYTPVNILFEEGSYAELSFGMIMPEASGVDFLGNPTGNVAKDFNFVGAAVKLQFSDRFSMGLIFDQPYGADTQYVGAPAATLLGGTAAKADSNAITAMLKYQINDRVSIYGGPRYVEADGNITLSGLAYGPLSGYNVDFASEGGFGYVVGAAYERPELGMRISGTYHSAVDLNFNSVETIPVAAGGTGTPIPTGVTPSETPQSFELAGQTGINPRTLIFASVRWSEWSGFTLNPPSPVPNLAQLDDAWTYRVGVGRKFSEKFSGSFSVTWEPGGSDSLVSPLAPTNGQTAFTIAGRYKLTDRVNLSGGVRYTMLGNALPETGTPDTPRASFRNNDALSIGLQIGFKLN